MYLSLTSILTEFAYNASQSEREKAFFAGALSLITAASAASNVRKTVTNAKVVQYHVTRMRNRNQSEGSSQKAA